MLVDVLGKTGEDLKDDDIGSLSKQIRGVLHLEERGYSQIIGSYSSAIAQFRNKLGETSHGKDVYSLEANRNALFEDEVRFLLATTDNIAFFLLSYYKNLYPLFSEKKKALVYDEQKDFNNWFDETQQPVALGGVELIPSRTLFDGDIVAYKLQLEAYKEKNNLIEELKISPNFATTHTLLRELSQYDEFSRNQIRSLRDALISNNQINWIISDSDVEAFFRRTLLEEGECFSVDELKQLEPYFKD